MHACQRGHFTEQFGFLIFSESTYEEEFVMFMRSQEALLGIGEKAGSQVQGLSPQQQSAMMRLAKHRAFRDLVQQIKGNPVSCESKSDYRYN